MALFYSLTLEMLNAFPVLENGNASTFLVPRNGNAFSFSRTDNGYHFHIGRQTNIYTRLDVFKEC